MRNYKSTLEHFIALRRGERKSRYTGYTSCEEGEGVGIRRSTFLPTGTKWEGETRNELWSKEPRFLSRKIVVTLLCGGNLPFDGYRGLCLDERRRSHDSTVEIAHYFFLLHLGENIYIYTAIRKEKTGFLVYENDLGLFFLDVNENFFLGGDDDFPNNNTGKNNIEFVSKGWNLVKTNIWPWLFIWRGDCETMIKILLYRDKNIETGFSLLPIF